MPPLRSSFGYRVEGDFSKVALYPIAVPITTGASEPGGLQQEQGPMLHGRARPKIRHTILEGPAGPSETCPYPVPYDNRP